ncbi:PREDICTED: cytochrome P450 6B2-like [Papilio xuthus]|uniref:unspecific monooxygenase n=1 Tax=Papilio xuthus TaxID=66420 RepID=A0AAJ7E400_PAPXU|nr:PREDICTED: cytochrome P450 6B2-like [Papilio xuthus]
MFTIALALVVLCALYWYGTRTFKYWENKGIKHDKPVPFFGNSMPLYLMKKSVTQMCTELYWKYPNEKVVGNYGASNPELIVRNPDFVKRILITDFAHFYPRGLNTHKTVVEPLLRNLFFADGDLWKLLRQRLSPAFTSGKLKTMFPLIVERAERLVDNAINAPPAGRVLDSRELMARYTTDFIGACGFGLDANSLNTEESAFRRLGAKIFQTRVLDIFIQMSKEMFPEICKHLKVLGKVEKDVISLVQSIVKERNYEPSDRNDFIDLLLECRRKGKMVGESIEKRKTDGSPQEVSLDMDDFLMAAQVFVFFAAGFETSSSATSFTLHQLAYHPEVQKEVQEEIDSVLSKYNNKLCYDAVNELNYLHCVFKEALRMFPSLGFLIRKCASRYTFPGSDLTIDEGVAVLIPVQAFHMDPQFFDDPEMFKPERFLCDFINPMTKNVYLPFGSGPRACVGERLGLMQSLAGLAAVLSRYSVEPAPQSLHHPRIDPSSNIVQSVVGGLPLLFRPRVT